jgi:preprotein translocase subunit SecD
MARNAAAHAGRTLIVFAIGIGVLFGLVAIGGTWKPALGLDLQGGTRITLTANGNPSQENLDEAASIIDSRVNATGFSEAEVTTQGSQYIVVEVPGDTDNSLLDTVNRQAQLRFRTVACTSIAPGPCASATPADPSADPSASTSAEPGVGVTLPPSPSATVKGSDKAKPKDKSSAKPKNRPAFTADDKKSDKKNKQAAAPSKTPSATASGSPSESPSGSPSSSPSAPADAKGATAEEALAFITAPPQEAIDAFAAYTCPTAKLPVDDPTTWLVTCGTEDDAATKYLLSPAAIEGTDLKSASALAPSTQNTQWQVNLELGGDGKKAFADLSDSMAGTEQQFAVVLDGQVISAPNFEGRIPDGNAQITGNFNKTSAESLATSLKFGALPISFDREGTQIEEIGPSLAGNQLQAGLTAGLLGLILVMLYCLVYYRGLGLVVLASLLTAAAITYGMVLLLGNTAGFTLTLPGIAGLVIGVGVTADSFIIFFERIRDEMREGKSMRVAVETGWVRAKKTRLAANVVSLLSAGVLYFFATGAVKGFGFALGLSTLIDLAILFWFTKPMVTFLARFKFFNGGGELSGLSANTLGIDRVATGGKA